MQGSLFLFPWKTGIVIGILAGVVWCCRWAVLNTYLVMWVHTLFHLLFLTCGRNLVHQCSFFFSFFPNKNKLFRLGQLLRPHGIFHIYAIRSRVSTWQLPFWLSVVLYQSAVVFLSGDEGISLLPCISVCEGTACWLSWAGLIAGCHRKGWFCSPPLSRLLAPVPSLVPTQMLIWPQRSLNWQKINCVNRKKKPSNPDCFSSESKFFVPVVKWRASGGLVSTESVRGQ